MAKSWKIELFELQEIVLLIVLSVVIYIAYIWGGWPWNQVSFWGIVFVTSIYSIIFTLMARIIVPHIKHVEDKPKDLNTTKK